MLYIKPEKLLENDVISKAQRLTFPLKQDKMKENRAPRKKRSAYVIENDTGICDGRCHFLCIEAVLLWLLSL